MHIYCLWRDFVAKFWRFTLYMVVMLVAIMVLALVLDVLEWMLRHLHRQEVVGQTRPNSEQLHPPTSFLAWRFSWELIVAPLAPVAFMLMATTISVFVYV